MSVPAPITWRVLEAVQSLLQVIRTASGYWTDMGANALLETRQTPDSQLPDVVITGKPAGTTKSGRAFRASSMQVFLEARVPATRDDAQRLAWNAHADLLRAIPTRLDSDNPALIGMTSLDIESDDVLQRSDGQPFILVQIVLRVGLVTATTPA